jgi:tetratricopeptide (TPR) repeat protein
LYISILRGAAIAQDPDLLYADRTNLASAVRAADLWEAELARNPDAFDAAWKLARACYWLGGHAPERDRRGHLEQGIAAGEKAIALQPDRPEGHFWLAANMGTLAEAFGLRAGLRYRGRIRRELEIVLRIDPAFMDGSADRALGRWYQKVPRLFGGNRRRAEAHLRASLEHDPHNTVSHFFLAELLIDEGRHDEAKAELQAILDAPHNPEWAPEDADYKARARALLAGLDRRVR